MMQVPWEMRLTQRIQKAPSYRQRTVTHRRHGTSGPPDGDPSDNGSSGDDRHPSRHGPPRHGAPEVDHQEEDLLVHLEILDLQDLKDHQEYLDLKEKEDIQDLQDLKDHQDHWEEQCSHPIYTEINPLLKWC